LPSAGPGDQLEVDKPGQDCSRKPRAFTSCDQHIVRKKPLDKGVVVQQRIVEEVDIDAGQ
jgi:hypothetical protein